MRKILFISNISRKITNFSIPSIYAAKELNFEFHMAANYSEFDDNTTKYDVHLHHVDIDRNPFSLKNYRAYKQLMMIIEENKIDFIHCNTPIGGVLGRLCGKNNPRIKKVIYTAHGFHFYEGAPLFNNTVLKLSEKIMAKYTDAIITMNREDYNNAKKFNLKNNGKVYYVPGVGVDTSSYQDIDIDESKKRREINVPDDAFLLISTGELIDRKNFDTAIKALAQTNNNIHLVICGTGPNIEMLKTLTKDLEIEERVHFLGFRSDIKELLKISDVFIFTSYQEGLPRSLMEAMSSGLPCVVSNIRGNVDLIKNKEGGYLNSPNDINGFANSINKIISDENLRNNMGQKNLLAIKPFDTRNIEKEIKKIYINELKVNNFWEN